MGLGQTILLKCKKRIEITTAFKTLHQFNEFIIVPRNSLSWETRYSRLQFVLTKNITKTNKVICTFEARTPCFPAYCSRPPRSALIQHFRDEFVCCASHVTKNVEPISLLSIRIGFARLRFVFYTMQSIRF